MTTDLQRSRNNELRLIPFKGDALTLTEAESKRLAELESQIDRDNASIGRALREIRDSRLYRATHPNFEAYLNQKWDLSKAHAYRLIQFANEVDSSPMGDKPRNERQSREKTTAKRPSKKRPTGPSLALTQQALRKFHKLWTEDTQSPTMHDGEPQQWVSRAQGSTADEIARDAYRLRALSLSGKKRQDVQEPLSPDPGFTINQLHAEAVALDKEAREQFADLSRVREKWETAIGFIRPREVWLEEIQKMAARCQRSVSEEDWNWIKVQVVADLSQ